MMIIYSFATDYDIGWLLLVYTRSSSLLGIYALQVFFVQKFLLYYLGFYAAIKYLSIFNLSF